MKVLLSILCLVTLLASCGTIGKFSRSAKRTKTEAMVDPLTYEQRRKYDYFFLEAVRLKQKGEYDAACS